MASHSHQIGELIVSEKTMKQTNCKLIEIYGVVIAHLFCGFGNAKMEKSPNRVK